MRWLSFIPSTLCLFTPVLTTNCMLFYRTLTDVYDGVRFGRIALQYPQGKADQQQLHLGISARRLIQALLGCPILSKWSTQRKKRKKKKDDQCKNRTVILLLAQQETQQKICFFFKATKASRPQEGGAQKKDEEEPTGTRGKTEKTGSPVRERPALPLSLSPLSLRSGV